MEVLPYTSSRSRRKRSKREYSDDTGKVWEVNMISQRYRVFKDNCKCVICGVEGTEMRLEREDVCDDDFPPHFNLYAIGKHGDSILITQDHIIPKSKGGRNVQKNLQTMCEICNNSVKKDQAISNEEVKELRRQYDHTTEMRRMNLGLCSCGSKIQARWIEITNGLEFRCETCD